jgi:hypothetical protein
MYSSAFTKQGDSMALNLITRQEYKAYAGIKSTNYDVEIDELIPRVSQLVKNYCRRTFVDYMDTEKIEVFSGDCDKLILSESPVVSVNLVQQSDDYGQTYRNLVRFTDWIDDGDYIVPLNADEYWAKKIRGYRIIYTAGYEDVPADVALAVMDLVTYYRQNDGAIHSTKAPGTNNVQIEYISTTSLPAHIRRVLDLYVADYT